MKLLNPIYDSVFKYLMEDLEIAKGFISTIIGSEITELYPAPQEATSIALTLKHNQLPLHRMDYVAIIKMGEDKFEKVVVEVQKSPFIPEIERFRNYLAEKYSKISTYKLNDQQIEEHLPIKTIYLLDKKLSDTLPAVLHRKGDYYDVLYQKKYEGEKNKYVELLTHDSWFIQIEKLPPDLKNDLTKILSVFAPWMRDPDEEFYINVDDKELLDKKHALFHRILLRLQNATHNKNLLLALKTESQIEDEIEKYIKQAEKERLQKEAALAKEKEERRQKDEALAKEKEKSIKFAEKMLKYGETIEEIMQETGLTREEIEEIKKKLA
jgi:hypothetical protein